MSYIKFLVKTINYIISGIYVELVYKLLYKKPFIPIKTAVRPYQLAAAAVVDDFSFLSSLVAQVATVLVRLVRLLLPCANISLIGSTSRTGTIGAPKAVHKSPMMPDATATVPSECSTS